MPSDKRFHEVISHFKFTVQSGIETDMGEVQEGATDWQKMVGLYLQSQLTALGELEEEEVRKELNFFFQRPTSKIQGLIL